ncbi:myo-inositol-1(or 4)-monophosphatase [Sphaerotilus hippei]|uniref:inositol-phosphate phosphatase n=1 Tax=Sphaerotilus hippei TaxID=744406 RepID=A0A318H8N7_9BURK|nr:myo-inositol-1(or 4)-monophosphatase [Sphaerotilus hippei]
MSQANLHPMLNIAIKAARAAGAIINRASLDLDRLTVTSKGPNDFVTEVDQAAEQAIIDTLLQAYPGHAILGEETGRAQGAKHSDFVWIIDPLDGTTNFIHGFPQYAVSIALAFKGRVEQAVVYDPSRNDLFYATKGRGAYLNDKRLRVSRRIRLADCLIGTGFPFRKGDNFRRYMKMFDEIMQSCAGVRRPGAAALDLCYVAAGWYDGFFETGLQPWDVAAGSLIVTEAGGLVGNFTGEADYLYQRELVCGSPKIYAQLVQILAPYTRMIKDDEPAAETRAAAAQAAAPAPAKPARSTSRLKTRVTAAAAEAEAAAAAPADEVLVPFSASRPGSTLVEPTFEMTPAQALAAAFDPVEEEAPAPVPVVVRKPTRIRKADMPPAEPEPAPRRGGPRRDDDAPF